MGYVEEKISECVSSLNMLEGRIKEQRGKLLANDGELVGELKEDGSGVLLYVVEVDIGEEVMFVDLWGYLEADGVLMELTYGEVEVGVIEKETLKVGWGDELALGRVYEMVKETVDTIVIDH